jgi:hypothetical protein
MPNRSPARQGRLAPPAVGASPGNNKWQGQQVALQGSEEHARLGQLTAAVAVEEAAAPADKAIKTSEFCSTFAPHIAVCPSLAASAAPAGAAPVTPAIGVSPLATPALWGSVAAALILKMHPQPRASGPPGRVLGEAVSDTSPQMTGPPSAPADRVNAAPQLAPSAPAVSPPPPPSAAGPAGGESMPRHVSNCWIDDQRLPGSASQLVQHVKTVVAEAQ